MIGVFDSGVGGLTVVKEIFKKLPQYQIIYFGDTARLPYGTKGADFVKRCSEKIASFLIKKEAKIIVIACHTCSAWASEFLKKKFKIPIFDMVKPAVNEILFSKKKRIGIIGTPGTIESGIYEKEISEKNFSAKIYSVACPLFVPLIEEGWIDKKITKEIIREYLKPLKGKIDVLVLACTHYPILRTQIEKFLGKGVKIINPAESLVKEIKSFLKENPQVAKKIKKGKKHKFFFSDKVYNFEKISRMCLKKKIFPVIFDPF